MSQNSPIDRLMATARLRPVELLPWIIALLFYFYLPQMLPLGAQIIVMIIFALSMDLIAGYTGIITLGHAAFFGIGAYSAGILSATFGVNDPIVGLVAGGMAGGVLGLLTGGLMLRAHGLALLILSLALLLVLQEAANQAFSLTGGADGLAGMNSSPLFGTFTFGFDGRILYLYALGVLFLCWAYARTLVCTPFGRRMVGIRENRLRMSALGVNVKRTELVVFCISSAMAGVAGALSAQIDQFVSLNALGFELSSMVLVVLIFGGMGRLYGAFVGR